MSNKKEPRYIELATGAHMRLSLDPAIYDAGINTKLGITATIAEAAKFVPVTLAQAAKSTGAQMLRCRCTRGAGDTEESRIVRLICETSKVAAVKSGAGTIVGDTLRLGGVTTSNWTITSVS